MTSPVIKNTKALIAHLAAGNSAKYVFFWDHRENGGQITKACFSQWYPAPFCVDDKIFPTAEHFMMAEKARLFGDTEKMALILAAKEPGKAKAIGREVLNFDQSIWDMHKFGIVVRGNLEKFRQNPDLCEFLRNTGNRVLVEVSPVDSIWGIGLAADDPQRVDPKAWKGENLLGFALMEVRHVLNKTQTRAGSTY